LRTMDSSAIWFSWGFRSVIVGSAGLVRKGGEAEA